MTRERSAEVRPSRTEPRETLLRADGRPRQRLRRDDRRGRILDAALDVFSRHGYEATSMEAIAVASGVARPVLYDHFRSKKDVFLSVLERERQSVMDHVVAESAGNETAEVRIRRVIDGFFRYVETHPATWRTLFQDVVGDAEVLAAQRRIQGAANMLVARQLVKKRGPLAGIEGQRLEVLAELWGWGLKGLARWWYEHPEVSREQLVTSTMDALWPGLRELLGARPRAGA